MTFGLALSIEAVGSNLTRLPAEPPRRIGSTATGGRLTRPLRPRFEIPFNLLKRRRIIFFQR